MSKPLENPRTEKDNNSSDYYDLIAEVGDQGAYQKLVVTFLTVLLIVNGFFALGNPYYFATTPFKAC